MGDLPPLPPYMYGREVEKNERVWSEQCMRAYAEEAVKLEREACATLCASLVTNDWDRSGSEEGAFNIGCEECAAAIRARSG